MIKIWREMDPRDGMQGSRQLAGKAQQKVGAISPPSKVEGIASCWMHVKSNPSDSGLMASRLADRRKSLEAILMQNTFRKACNCWHEIAARLGGVPPPPRSAMDNSGGRVIVAQLISAAFPVRQGLRLINRLITELGENGAEAFAPPSRRKRNGTRGFDRFRIRSTRGEEGADRRCEGAFPSKHGLAPRCRGYWFNMAKRQGHELGEVSLPKGVLFGLRCCGLTAGHRPFIGPRRPLNKNPKPRDMAPRLGRDRWTRDPWRVNVAPK